MNQPNLPIAAPRTAQAPEGAEMLVLLRRFALLLTLGTIAGALIGTGLFLYTVRYEPRYTASVPYRIMPKRQQVGREMNFDFGQNSEEVALLIHQQQVLFQQDAFLEEVLHSPAFHTDPSDPNTSGNGESGWLRDNKKDVMTSLKRDLRIVPRVNAGVFEITMTAKDPFESFTLVKAAQETYENYLRSDDSGQKNQRLRILGDARTKAEAAFNSERESLASWAKVNEVDVQRTRYEVEKSALQQRTEESIRVTSLSVLADSQLTTIKKLLEKFTDSNSNNEKLDPQKVEGVDAEQVLKLTPDTELQIENDPTLRWLDNQRLSWLQEQNVELGKAAPSRARLKEIDDRLKSIADQRKVERNRLRWEAAERMLTRAVDDANSQRALKVDAEKERSQTSETVLRIGEKLMDYQQRSDQLKAKEQLFSDFDREYRLEQLNGGNDQRIQVLAAAMKPDVRSSPRWYTYIPLGTMAGLGLSGLLAYILFLSDTRVRTPRDITRTLQLTLLGFVPDESDDRTLGGDVETAILTSPGSMVAEAFRQIRSHIMAQTAHNPANTLLVASITPGGGATTVACNIAAAMALNEMRVLLVDANFYRPGINRIFTDVPAIGLANALADLDTLEDCISAHPSLPKLHLMGAGSDLGGASSEMFESKAFRDLMDRLKSRYDMVIFDGAPLNLVSDSLALAARVDGVVSVVRADEVSRGTVSRVRDQLRSVHSNLLGFVLNAVQTNNSGYFKENYRTFYRYAGQGRRTSPKLLGS